MVRLYRNFKDVSNRNFTILNQMNILKEKFIRNLIFDSSDLRVMKKESEDILFSQYNVLILSSFI